MSDYIIVNGELHHHGVKGMKWGVRKEKYVTVARAHKNAKNAGKEAYDKSISESRRSSDSGRIGSYHRAADKASIARRKAMKESFAKDVAYNKNLRQKRSADFAKMKLERTNNMNEFKQKRLDISESRSTGRKIATNLLAGPFANRTYNSVLAAGGSRTKARAVTAVTGLMGGSLGLGHLIVSGFYEDRAAIKGNHK